MSHKPIGPQFTLRALLLFVTAEAALASLGSAKCLALQPALLLACCAVRGVKYARLYGIPSAIAHGAMFFLTGLAGILSCGVVLLFSWFMVGCTIALVSG